jgi:hypothetical protein
MFSLFKRRTPAPSTGMTFKTRVAQFWKWYVSVAERFYQTIEDKRCADLAPEVSAKVHELIPGFAWVFGPGADGHGHSFTLSGEGNPHRQLLAAYWQTQAPTLAGWSFYGSRQPSRQPENGHLEIGGHDFDPKAFWLTPSINSDTEKIDLTVWHPLFPQLDDRARWTVLFLFLDEALGEIGTQNWIGQIQINDTELAGAIPLSELRAFAERVQTENNWKKGAPGGLWTVYRFETERADQPRGDIVIGSSGMMALINEFLEAKGELPDPLAGTGADYLYVALDAGTLPEGGEVAARGKIEDALVAALEPAASGRLIGGALGRRFAYIDMLLFDGADSLSIVRDTLRDLRLPRGTSLNFFAHEKRGHRVVL